LTLGKHIAAVARHICPKEVKVGRQFSSNHDVGASMSVLEAIIFALILVWAPGLMLSAYLTFGPRRSID